MNEKSMQKRDKKANFLFFILIWAFSLFMSILLYIYRLNNHISIGWDTPAYIHSINFLENNSFFDFLIFKKGTYLSYPLIDSFIRVFYSLEPIFFENIFTIIMIVLFYFSLFVLLKNKSLLFKISFFIFIPLWVGLLNFFVSTRANFLSLILFLFLIPVFIKTLFYKKNSFILVYFLIITIGFIHPESGVFFSIILIFSLLLFFLSKNITFRQFIKKSIFLGILSIIPLSISWIYSLNTLQFFNYSSEIISSLTPQLNLHFYRLISWEIGFVLITIVSIGLIKNIGFIKNLKIQKNSDMIFILWFFLTLLLFIASIFFVNLRIHSLRLVGLFPLPFILSLAIIKYKSKINTKALSIILILVLILGFFNMFDASKSFQRPFIEDSTLEILESVNTNSSFDKILFVFLPSDTNYGGGIADFWKDWVNVYIQKDFNIYLGRIEDLSKLKNTNFQDPYLSYKTEEYNQFLKNLTREDIGEYDVIIIKEFYRGKIDDVIDIPYISFPANQ